MLIRLLDGRHACRWFSHCICHVLLRIAHVANIAQLMNVSGLNRDNVASHLQKHRLGLKRGRSRRRQAGSAAKVKARRKGGVAADATPAHGADAEQLDGEHGPSPGGGTSELDAHTQQGTQARTGTAQHWQDQAGSNEREGSNQRERGHGGSNEGNGECTGRDQGAERSDDGNGAGSDNRNSCIDDAKTQQGQDPRHPSPVAGLVGSNGCAQAGAVVAAMQGMRTAAPLPPTRQHTSPDQECFGSGAGSNGELKHSGSAPASGGIHSRIGSSRATAGSGNAAATADIGSLPQHLAPLAPLPAPSLTHNTVAHAAAAAVAAAAAAAAPGPAGAHAPAVPVTGAAPAPPGAAAAVTPPGEAVPAAGAHNVGRSSEQQSQ